MKDNHRYIQDWLESYRKDVVGNILPFWLQHGLDKVNGGIYTCLDRDGTLMDSTKSVWFQGRFAFTCSYAYNHIEKKKEWLDAAKSAIDFIEKYCFDKHGRMYFEVMADGTPLRMRRYVFSETFAIIAFSEYSIASGDKTYAHKSLDLFKRTLNLIKSDSLPPKYLDTLKVKGHSLTMILINTANRVRAAIEDPVLDEQIEESISALRQYFVHSEYKALLETVGENGEMIDTSMGRTVNPGHSIETAWFLLDEAKHRNWDKDLVKMATTILDWSWQWGWDKKHGGMNNFVDCKGYPHQDYSQNMKFWWPHTEAVIATLYAYLATKDEKYLAMHKQVSDYTYQHFPDGKHGEWYGYLNYDGTVAQSAKGNLFKGPFHIPRMMIKSYLLCQEIIEDMDT